MELHGCKVIIHDPPLSAKETPQKINRCYFEKTKKPPIFATAKKEKQFCFKIYCGVEQLVARWAHNPKVVSSSLAPATEKVENQSLKGLFSTFFILTPLIHCHSAWV